MTEIHNTDAVPEDYISDPRFESGLMTKFLGAAGGSEKIYISIDYVKPGSKSVKYHSHAMQEEFFLILKGRGTLRLDDRTMSVGPGDFFSKPAGKGTAHQFINTGDVVLEILDCGTKHEDDIISYPDEDIMLVKETGMAYRRGERIEGWSAEPGD